MSDRTQPLPEPSPRDRSVRDCIDRYWRRNVALMAGLLFVWAAVSLGGGVLFADALGAIRLGGFPLGFWLAQQGSILTFVLLVLVYALAMGRLDRQHHAELQALAIGADREASEPQ
jgi:putative solute:sodium symporter small subunit